MSNRRLRSSSNQGSRLALLAAAVAASLAAHAEDDPVKELTTPESTASAGAGYVNENNRRFGEYRGLTETGGYALLDLDFLNRNNETGTWLKIYGRDLGLSSREMGVEYEKQGEWGGFVEYSQIPRDYPVLLNTGLAGIGTADLTINGTPKRDVFLGTQRDRYTLGFNVGLPADLVLDVRFRDEAKDGTRLFGRGTGELLVEPIDSRTRQMEATLTYTGKRLQLMGGYYGTQFSNSPSYINVATGTDISLAPDNQSHQLYVGGGYNFTSLTRATFKVSYGRATQDETFFIPPDFPGNTQTNLDGEIDTTAVQAGLTTRFADNISFLANFRYEDRDDKTPLHQYLSPSTGRDGYNTPFSRTTTAGKVEATYFAAMGFSFTGSIDYDQRKRSVLSLRQASWREENDELTYRLEARRSLSETLNGSLSYAYSDRGGSDFLPANNNTQVDYVDPIHFADRKRDKIRLGLDWTPIEVLSLQLIIDTTQDDYHTRDLGPSEGASRLYSLDATYTLSEAWQLNAWVSHDENHIKQSTLTGANGTAVPAGIWTADLQYEGDAIGLGVRGRPTDKIEIGADLTYQDDSTKYGMIPTFVTTVSLPNIANKQKTAEIFARYIFNEKFSMRADVEYAQYDTDDWTWAGWVYSDTSTGFLDPHENVLFVGLSLQYKMR